MMMTYVVSEICRCHDMNPLSDVHTGAGDPMGDHRQQFCVLALATLLPQ